MQNSIKIPYLLIKKKYCSSDYKLKIPQNNGRKILVEKILPSKEKKANNVIWKPFLLPRKTPVVIVGKKGFEVATFTQSAKQEYHKHPYGIECYTVIKGKMTIFFNNKNKIILNQGDECIVFPNTFHKIVNK